MNVFVVHWDEEELRGHMDALSAPGYGVRGHWSIEEHADIRMNLPDVLVLSLDRLPSHSRAIAEWMWEARSRRRIPIIFAGGAPDKVEATERKFPEAWFCSWEEVPDRLAKLAPE